MTSWLVCRTQPVTGQRFPAGTCAEVPSFVTRAGPETLRSSSVTLTRCPSRIPCSRSHASGRSSRSSSSSDLPWLSTVITKSTSRHCAKLVVEQRSSSGPTRSPSATCSIGLPPLSVSTDVPATKQGHKPAAHTQQVVAADGLVARPRLALAPSAEQRYVGRAA